jgi:hypothetical protein
VAATNKAFKAKKAKEPKITIANMHDASNKRIADVLAKDPDAFTYKGVKTVAANGRNIDDATIDAIKAKNLARLKEVSRKYQPGQYAVETNPGVDNFDPIRAKAEVDAFMNGDVEEMERDYPVKLSYADTEALTGINPGSYD